MTQVIIKPENQEEIIISTSLSAEEIEKLIKLNELSKAKLETAILSETALKNDWLSPEEDEAWKDL
ncbi:hypothetical protein JCM14244_00890 [Venenivibrio stagnispumantis]|uniref:DUF2281 domain-containing protein n=1 Tax=Venenivibrio stagnispumantis TaxID=407998 RepID=A0AA45WK95_9AQUI|nr:hypothetical protein [Venenivibrio stagnispumantis]MCW4573524.1 hypothetical protein [Venenivibrio stagnispumantis]SMP06147.1 hypothetical protein SAMN06264868_10429 [Venenivibrio stagnispumantis]